MVSLWTLLLLVHLIGLHSVSFRNSKSHFVSEMLQGLPLSVYLKL